MRKNLGAVDSIIKLFSEESIEVPQDFGERIVKSAQRHYGGRLPSLQAIKAVIRISKFWKKYLKDEAEFSKLVCTKVYSMVEFHAAVIRSNEVEGGRTDIRKFKLNKNIELPKCACTIANEKGEAFLQPRFGAFRTEI